jgi:type IV pilus assembly protein PilC
MAIYIWSGKDRSGKKQKGEIEADNLPLARQMVIKKGIAVKSIKSKPKDLLEFLPAFGGKVKDKEKVIFVRQFSTMIDAGLPLVQCLEILQEQQENLNFKKVIGQIKKNVEEGSTLSDAIKRHPKVFDNLFQNLVAAGEVGGILDVILGRLAQYIEKAANLKKKVKSALTYPTIVISIAVIVVAVILIFVIPVFAGLFKNAGVKLPAMTLMVMNVSDFTKNYIFWILAGLVLIVLGLRRIYNTQPAR